MAMLILWATRLGVYLFSRALTAGDWRFQKVKNNFSLFFKFWTVQGIWIAIIGTPVYITALNQVEFHEKIETFEIIGGLIFLYGFFFETHIDPSVALSDGPNMLRIEDLYKTALSA